MAAAQRLEVVEILMRSIIYQENEELCEKFSRFRGDDVQWVLNSLHPMFEMLQESLELEAYGNTTY